MIDYVYQEYEKSFLAKFLGLPVNTFYRWNYKRWVKVRSKFEDFKDEAWAWWGDTGKFTNSKNVLMGTIWKRYKGVYTRKYGKTFKKSLGL
jgi:hypothetical protein